MPEEGGEAGRWYRLLGEVGRLQQPFEEREHGTDSRRRVARRRHRGARWASFVDRMRAGREASCRDYDIAGYFGVIRGNARGSDRTAAPYPLRESSCLRRREAENPPRPAVGGEPQRSVRPLAHVADAFAQLLQQALLLNHLVAVNFEPHQGLAGQRADKEVAAPRREQIAGQERHARRCDRRHPVPQRLLHSRLVRALVDLGAAVVDAVADHRPTVILALLDNVDLVAAARAVFVLPQLACGGVQRETLRIAMAVAPDFRFGAGLAGERIVGRHRAIRPDADDLAEVVSETLRLVARSEMLAQGQKEAVIRRLHDAAAEMIAAGARAGLAEDHLDGIEPGSGFVAQPGAGERGARAAVYRLGVTEVDGAILREAAVERDIEQASLARREDRRHAGERRREPAVLGDDAHAPGPFGDQHSAVRQESDRPRMIQSLRDGLHHEVAGGGWKNLCAGARAAARDERAGAQHR